jgi:hypothetical protein
MSHWILSIPFESKEALERFAAAAQLKGLIPRDRYLDYARVLGTQHAMLRARTNDSGRQPPPRAA